jgi:hypothetical protein
MFNSPARNRLSYALPFGMIAACLWLLVGCLYIPTSPHVDLTGSKKDFRPLAGYDAAKKPMIAGNFSRSAIEAVLGPPPYVSENGRYAMYVIHVKVGLLIAPLCFTARDRTNTAVGLLLRYGPTEQLEQWDRFDIMPPKLLDEPYGLGASEVQQASGERDLLQYVNYSLLGASKESGPTTTRSDPRDELRRNAENVIKTVR